MKVKTHRLLGEALNWAVATCEDTAWLYESYERPYPSGTSYNTDRELGYDIIEREGITVGPHTTSKCVAHYGPTLVTDPWSDRLVGPTYLVAGLRCYVAKKLGYEVDVPDALCALIVSGSSLQQAELSRRLF